MHRPCFVPRLASLLQPAPRTRAWTGEARRLRLGVRDRLRCILQKQSFTLCADSDAVAPYVERNKSSHEQRPPEINTLNHALSTNLVMRGEKNVERRSNSDNPSTP